ncbi:restriction endonuclease subunit S [Campylobacter lari]|nr:restriction endonuclease subunit S [Campylobacter lari]
MNNWKKCKLGDIIDVKHGYAFKGHGITSKDNNKILVTPGNFNIGGGFKMDKCKYFDGDFPESYILKHNDIVLTMTDLSVDSDTLGYSAKIPSIKNKIFLHNQRIGLVIFNDNCVDRDFIYWLTRSPEYHNYIVCSSTGTSIRHTSPRLIKEFIFELPPLEEQRQIAAILSSIDDKIELLHEQNKTLEKLAQTLFRHYFIENPNPSWQNVKLGDLVEVVDNRGKTPPLSNENTIYPVIEVNSLNGESRVINYSVVRKYIDKETYDTWFRAGHPKKYDVLISTVGSIGELAMFLDDIGSIAQNVVALRASSDYKCYLYEALKFMKNDLKELDIGSVQPSIKIPHLLSLTILKPNGLILQKFNDEVLKFIDKISSNVKQIQTLENMRDILIPKLLNGEIKINN